MAEIENNLSNNDLLNLILWGQDCRFKYKNKSKKPYILFVKNKNQPRKVFYVRYYDGRQISTRCTDKRKANQFALEHLKNHTAIELKKQNKADEFHPYIENYYKENSPHIDYCNTHNRHIAPKERIKMYNVMNRISKLLPYITKFNQLSKTDLIELRLKLLKNGSEKNTPLSPKTVTSYFVHFERTYKELLDKEIITKNPFDNLPPLKIETVKNWDGFPIKPLKNKLPIVNYNSICTGQGLKDNDFIYSLISFLAIMTGTRKEELKKVTRKDLIQNKNYYWYKIAGTKTVNATRTIPITELTYHCLITYCLLKESKIFNHLIQNREYDKELLLYIGRICNINSIDELKNQNDGKSKIVYHGLRKNYKTVLSQENVNSDLIEFLIGHTASTSIGNANNINDVYLILDKADNLKINDTVIPAISYYEVQGINLKNTIQFYKDFNLILKSKIKENKIPVEKNRKNCNELIREIIKEIKI